MDFIARYLAEAGRVAAAIDQAAVARVVDLLVRVRDGGGRLFILGVGGSAGNASHAVNDFRKIAGFEAYAPTDNVSELTARINDDGWDTSFANWLKGSRLSVGMRSSSSRWGAGTRSAESAPTWCGRSSTPRPWARAWRA